MSPVVSCFKFAINLICVLLGKLLPNKFKRYILLTTIYTKGVNEKLFDNLNLKELNDKLGLVSDVKAMENISAISERLWSNVELNQLLKESIHCNLNGECVSLLNADSFLDQLIAMTPMWLRYKPSEMKRDIRSLFSREKVYLTV